jgi:hypothetical protein
VSLKHQGGCHPVYGMPPLLSPYAAFDKRPFGRNRRKAFIDQLNGHAGGPPDRSCEILRRSRLRASRPVEAAG